MSLVTIKDLLDTCVSLAEKWWLENEKNEKVLDPFIENFWLLIEDAITYQVYWDNPPEWDNFKIGWETPLEIETLKRIDKNLKEYSHWDLLFSNFHALLETYEEKEIFEETVRFVDQIWIENFREFARTNLISATVVWSPLYKLIMLIDEWKTMEEAIDIILKENGIDINVNPKMKLNPLVQKYILEFQNSIWLLIVKSNWNFLMEASSTIN